MSFPFSFLFFLSFFFSRTLKMSQVDLVNEDSKCKKCGEQYTNILAAKFKWCNPCQINYFKKNFTQRTSGNETIDKLIQEMQLKINSPFTIVFEWIPYNQFNNIKEIGRGCFSTVYSAIWRDGPLHCNYNKEEWIRETNKRVALKCLYNSQIITGEFINEVWNFKLNTCLIIIITIYYIINRLKSIQ